VSIRSSQPINKFIKHQENYYLRLTDGLMVSLVQESLFPEIVSSTMSKSQCPIRQELLNAAFLNKVEELSSITILDNSLPCLHLQEVQAISNLCGIIGINLCEKFQTG